MNTIYKNDIIDVVKNDTDFLFSILENGEICNYLYTRTALEALAAAVPDYLNPNSVKNSVVPEWRDKRDTERYILWRGEGAKKYQIRPINPRQHGGSSRSINFWGTKGEY